MATILDLALTIYMWLIIARALLTWVNPDPFNPIVQFLYKVTEPVLGWVRRRVPMIFGGLGAAIGVAPVFWVIAVMLGAGAWYSSTGQK